jgi:hypothetical protein
MRWHTRKKIFFEYGCVIAMLFCLLPEISYADIIRLEKGLMMHWSLDEGSGTHAGDASGSGNTGTITNRPTWVDGSRGKALQFDGVNDYISTTSINNSGTNVLSVAFWLLQNSFTNNNRLAMEATTDSNGSTTGLYINPNSSSPCDGLFSINVRGNVGLNKSCYDQPSAGYWHYYVITADKGQSVNESDLYIDGVLQTPTSRPSVSNNTNNFGDDPWYFMSRGGSSLFNEGKLDEFRLYNKVLSAKEVQALYHMHGKVGSVVYIDAQKSASAESDQGGTPQESDVYDEKRIAKKNSSTLLVMVPSDNVDTVSNFTDIAMTAKTSFPKRSIDALADNRVQVKFSDGRITRLVYDHDEVSDTGTVMVWKGVYKKPKNGNDEPMRLMGALETLEYFASGNDQVHFTSLSEDPDNDSGETLHFSFDANASGLYMIERSDDVENAHVSFASFHNEVSDTDASEESSIFFPSLTYLHKTLSDFFTGLFGRKSE